MRGNRSRVVALAAASAASVASIATATPGAPFIVRTGPCAGSYDGIFISTDLEPDDAAALKVIAPRLRGTPLLVVVGEGNAPAGAKCSLAADIFASYSLDEHATIVQGRGSSAAYPAAALRAYSSADGAPRPHRATIVADESEEAVARRVADFCGHCEAPFALLLKPPHEMVSLPAEALSRVAAAAYGSFNFTELRDVMRGKAPSLSEEDAFARQEAFLHGFKTCLWVERSNSVGRDATLSNVETDPVWPVLAADAGVVNLVTAWSEHSVLAIADKVGQLKQEIGEILSRPATSPEERFGRIGTCVSRHEKRLAIMASIASTGGQQMPLADPLVTALLLDDEGRLAPFVRRCRAGHDTKGKPTAVADESSTVAAVAAHGAAEAELLYRATLEVIAAALREGDA